MRATTASEESASFRGDDSHGVGVAHEVSSACVCNHPFQHGQKQSSASCNQRGHRWEIPGARHFHDAGSFSPAQLSRKDSDFLCLVLSNLEFVDFGIDSIAPGVRQDFEKIIERVAFLFSLSLFNDFAKEIIRIRINRSCPQRNGVHALLNAHRFDPNGSQNLRRSSR